MSFPASVAIRRLFVQAVPLIIALAILAGCETPPEKIVKEKPPAPVTPQQPDPQLITARETIGKLQAEIAKLKQYSSVQKGQNLELQLQLLMWLKKAMKCISQIKTIKEQKKIE